MELCDQSPLGLPTMESQKSLCWVDGPFQNGSVTVSLSLLHTKAANKSVMNDFDQIDF